MKKVIDIAYKYLGYKEKPVNITEFAAYFEGSDFYNGSKGDGKTWGCAWCDIFVDYCYCNAYGMETARKMLYQPKKSAGAGCKFSADYFRAHNAFIKSGEGLPQVGDQIFFGRYGNESHTGIVVKVSDKKVFTIEGNSDDMVKEHSYYLTSITKISGYGRPDWSLVTESTPAPTPKIDWPQIPARGYFKSGDHGSNVVKMQKILELVCPGCLKEWGCDGVIGSETLSGIAQTQYKVHVRVDELYGPKTQEACKKYLNCI